MHQTYQASTLPPKYIHRPGISDPLKQVKEIPLLLCEDP